MKNESDASVDFIKHLLENVFALKYFYIACIILFMAIAFFFNKYSPREYELRSTIGAVRVNPSSVLTSNEMFRGSTNMVRNIEDPMNSLNSFSLITSTISDLNFEVGYYSEKKGILKQTTEMYSKSPFQVTIDKSHIQPINSKFYITILSDSTFRLSALNKESALYNYIDNNVTSIDVPLYIDTICKFNKTITGKYYKFSVTSNKDWDPSKHDTKNIYYFELYHIEGLAKFYLKNLEIEPKSMLSSIIDVKFTGNNINKSIIFLNAYVNKFLEENLAKKNKIAVNTIDFIDTQISDISDSLSNSESQLRNFRTANLLATDLSFQGQQTYSQMERLEAERSDLKIQQRYYNYVISYLQTNEDVSGVVPPISANITDPIMNTLITDLVAYNTERSSIVSNNNEKNLFLAQLDQKIRNQKQAIIENVMNNLNTINLTLNELDYRADKLAKEIANLPRTEMNMVNIQRKFNLNDVLYTFLLQKRSEAAIALASNYPDYEVLEPARAITSVKTKPKTTINYLIALFIGFLIPTMLLIIRLLLNDKISSVFDTEHILDRPILGTIYNNRKKYEAVIQESPNSAISESFRNLRSSIFLKLKSDQSKIILVSSSQPQEGKSFISFNIAASIASVGFKTVLIDCDLRRPVLHHKFSKENSMGISNYLVRKAMPDDIINETNTENLSFIMAGPLLPNPSELLSAGALDGLIESLKSRFEYIIMDTAPIQLVSDSIQLMKYSSMIILVVRLNTTKKDTFRSAINALDMNEITNYDIVLNDLTLDKSPYSHYKGYYQNE